MGRGFLPPFAGGGAEAWLVRHRQGLPQGFRSIGRNARTIPNLKNMFDDVMLDPERPRMAHL